jgi:hypothetical protein
MMISRPSESTHWYTKKGEPAYSVKAKDGSFRPATLRDAKKMGLLPSVTTIIKAAANPGLEAWKLNQMMLAAMTLPRAPDESEESFVHRVQTDSKEHARKAAQRGTEIHTDIEKSFSGHRPKYPKVNEAVKEVFGDLQWSPEKSFSSDLGFGGKVDLHSSDGQGVVIDFKTKEFTQESLGKVSIFDEHSMQLAAYREGLNLPNAQCAIVFVSTIEDLVVVKTLEEEQIVRGWDMFAHLTRYWYAKTQL